MNKKILIVTPIFPFPKAGADQADRFSGMLQIKKLGYQVKVIHKLAVWQSIDKVKEVQRETGIEFIPVSYKYSNKTLTFKEIFFKFLEKIKNPFFLDGAALEYSEPEIQKNLIEELDNWKPDLVWFEYTYLWPLYHEVRRRKIPIITRSINFEPFHFLQEDGYTPLNFLKSFPKFLSEYLVVRSSNAIFSITPKEERIYKLLGGKLVKTLPLRDLPSCLRNSHLIRNNKPLQVFFMGSTYSVSHNRIAMEFVVKKIGPYFHKNYPGLYNFNILGAKIPESVNNYFKDNIIYHGYVKNLEKFLNRMDIALIPSFFGAGMQQKIFEPICRSIPTITSERGIAGYPFEHKKHVFLAKKQEDFINLLLEFSDDKIRRNISREGGMIARKIFAQQSMDSLVKEVIDKLV